MTKNLCVLLAIGLILGMWFLLFARALVRKNLVLKAAPIFQADRLSVEWNAAAQGIWRVIADARRMRLLVRHLDHLTPECLRDYKRYLLLSRVTTVWFIALVVFALFGNYVCGMQ